MSDPIVFDGNTFRSGAHLLVRFLGVDPSRMNYAEDEYLVVV